MARTDYHPKHQSHERRFRGIGAFTLVELLIAIVLGSIVVAALYDMLIAQNRAYSLHDDVAEMQQNLRIAIEQVARDISVTGAGRPTAGFETSVNGVNASGWYSGSQNNGAFTQKSYRITASGSNNTIDLMGCLEAFTAHLGASAVTGSNTITLESAAQGALFNTTTKSSISIEGVESANVKDVAAGILTIDTNPAVADNQGIVSPHATGATVCLVQWVTYSLGADGVLYVDRHQGAGNQAVAQNISVMTMQESVSGVLRVVTITLTARTRNPDRTTGQYITSQAVNKIFIRNS